MLPPTGHRLLDIGPGFGRLSEFYEGYEQVILLDYSRTLLRQAQEYLGRDGKFVYVAASFYAIPLVDSAIDTTMMVRVMHHAEDVPALLREVARILTGGGDYVLEFANKRHLKSIARYALRRQQWNPFNPEPVEFVEMNFDFHPAWMRARLAEAGFHVKHQRTVSHFRLPFLKRLIPTRTLAALDSLCQPTGAWWQYTPSVFVHAKVDKPVSEPPADSFFCCPACGGTDLHENPDALRCENCGRFWPVENGIYNFKVDL